eukprot:768056-Hanusia_phi.AAC.4
MRRDCLVFVFFLVLSKQIAFVVPYVAQGCIHSSIRRTCTQRAVHLRCSADAKNVEGDVAAVRQYRSIECWYESRILRDPIHAEDLVSYGTYLQVVRGKAERAALMYEMALRIDPNLARKAALDQWIRNVSAADLVSIAGENLFLLCFCLLMHPSSLQDEHSADPSTCAGQGSRAKDRSSQDCPSKAKILSKELKAGMQWQQLSFRCELLSKKARSLLLQTER